MSRSPRPVARFRVLRGISRTLAPMESGSQQFASACIRVLYTVTWGGMRRRRAVCWVFGVAAAAATLLVLPASAAECTADEQCVSGNCQNGTCAGTRTPTPTFTITPTPAHIPPTFTPFPTATKTPIPSPTRKAPGLPCDTSHPEVCLTDLCTDNVCCSSSTCNPPSRCDIFGAEGDCSQPLPTDFPCQKNSDCAEPLVCQFFINLNGTVCAAPPPPTLTFPPSPPTSTSTPRPTPTPTGPIIRIGSARGTPGDAVDVTVSLAASGNRIAATANDIVFQSAVLSVDPATCQANPSIQKSLTASIISQDESQSVLRVFIRSSQNFAPIPDGPLYTCTFRISPAALPGTYLLTSTNVVASTPGGLSLTFVNGSDGAVAVFLILPVACVGDCDVTGSVSAADLLTMVSVALGHTPIAFCKAGDLNRDGRIGVDEILAGIKAAQSGCPLQAEQGQSSYEPEAQSTQ